MKIYKLTDMTKGWFVGDFEPSALRTQAMEVGVKRYKTGDTEAWHVHRVAQELTCVLEGSIEIGGKTLHAGEMILLEAGEGSSFKALTDATLVVVKQPSVANDKFFEDA